MNIIIQKKAALSRLFLLFLICGGFLLFACEDGSDEDKLSDAGSQADASSDDDDDKIEYPLDDTLRINHIQMKGTHNSYHVEPRPFVVNDWRLTMPPLSQQLDIYGVRQFELDIHYESEAALESGAHFISTDFPAPDTGEELGTSYIINIPDGTPSRCNPVTAPDECSSKDTENLARE